MAADSRTHAQALRVIGQHLAGLGLDAFLLKRTGDEYTVHIEREPSAASRRKNLFGSITDRLWGTPHETARSTSRLEFSSARILWLDMESRLRRVESNAMPDPGNLSLTLRVVGDYLDRKRVNGFAISWSSRSVIVTYGETVETFTRENLYDLGVHMYLRRSTRHAPRHF